MMEALLLLTLAMPPDQVGTMGRYVPEPAGMLGRPAPQESPDDRSSRLDLGLGIVSAVTVRSSLGVGEDWRCESFINSPAVIQAITNQRLCFPNGPCPFWQGSRDAVARESHVPPSVIGLLDFNGPSAIVWSVRPVVVDSVDGMKPGWARPHIGGELCKVVAPSVTYNDASSAVVAIPRVGRFVAPIPHMNPGLIKAAAGSSVRFYDLKYGSNSGASTALRYSFQQMPRSNDPFSAAIAATEPDGRPGRALQNEPHIVSGSSELQLVTHVSNSNADDSSSRNDLGLGIISISAAMVATGLTASCLAAKLCRETVPLTRWAFDRGPVWGVVGRAAVNGLIHYGVARWVPKGKWRTATLAVLAAINVTNAVLDIRTLQKIERDR